MKAGMRVLWHASFLCMGAAAPLTAQAVEEQSSGVTSRWRVVGVITGGESGIAVLKQLNKDKTHTLRVGQPLPGEKGAHLEAVRRRRVKVTVEGEAVRLAHVQTRLDERQPEPKARSFAERYYKATQKRAWLLSQKWREEVSRQEGSEADGGRRRREFPETWNPAGYGDRRRGSRRDRSTTRPESYTVRYENFEPASPDEDGFDEGFTSDSAGSRGEPTRW